MLEKNDPSWNDLIDENKALKMIEQGICTLKDFPEVNTGRTANSADKYPQTCVSDRHGSLTNIPIPIEERCSSLFYWWVDPYERQVCSEDKRFAYIPSGYLLPYWAGRYFGFITEDM